MRFELWFIWQTCKRGAPSLYEVAFSESEAIRICENLRIQQNQFGEKSGIEFEIKFCKRFDRLSELIGYIERNVTLGNKSKTESYQDKCYWRFVAYCAEKAVGMNVMDLSRQYERRANEIKESGAAVRTIHGERLRDLFSARDEVLARHDDVSDEPVSPDEFCEQNRNLSVTT